VGGHHDDVELRIGDLEAKVAAAAALVGASAHQGVSLGLSPHAPYTVPPAAMRSVLDLAARHGLPVTTHLAESRAEITYLTEGDGDLTEFMATRLGGVAPRSGGGGALAYAASGGLLAGGPGRRTLLVHCAQLEADDVDRLARAHVAVALCPRSNDRLCGGAQAPVAALAGSGIPLAVGTDSLASNAGLDLFAEARALYEIWLRQERGCDPIAVAGRLLRMLTSEGAAALGLDAEAGSLRVGDRADFTALEVPAGPGDVARAVVEGADATAVLTTFIGGRCRYIRGSASPGGEESDDRTDSARAERTAP
jgi:5-methylthioadenosine/S-adenosylhomocysteine deaminase